MQCIPCTEQLGFIPDIKRILVKYGLSEYLEEFKVTGEFQPKLKWKNIVHTHVKDHEQSKWLERMSVDRDFVRFIQIHREISKVSQIWAVARRKLGLLFKCRFLARLCVMPYKALEQPQNCTKCGKQVLPLKVRIKTS